MKSPALDPPALDLERDALFLDFDGTLVDFTPDPEAVRIRDEGVPLLRELQARLDGALAIVTGRPIASIDRFLSPLVLPTVGIHGQERRLADGAHVAVPVLPAIDTMRTRLRAAIGADDPLFLEDKGAAIVVHYRLRHDQKDRARAIANAAVAGLEGLVVHPGHAIFEIRQEGVSKAQGVAHLLTVSPFAGRRPVFVGDDLTDEDGFRAVQAAGGHGIKVGGGDTVAPFRLSDIEAVFAWLEAARGR